MTLVLRMQEAQNRIEGLEPFERGPVFLAKDPPIAR
jgi:hypothetical protein